MPSSNATGARTKKAPAPAIEAGEDAADGRADQCGDAPDARDQREGAAPEPLGEDQPDHRVAEGRQQPAAKALHGPAGEEDRHAGGHGAEERAEGKGDGSGNVGAARAEAERADGSEDRGEDRSDDEDRRVPGEEFEAADLADNGGQKGGADEGSYGLAADAAGQNQRGEVRPPKSAPKRLDGAVVGSRPLPAGAGRRYAYNLNIGSGKAKSDGTELTVGEVAERSGHAVSALHFYEQGGLVRSHRTVGNQRRYDRDVLRRLAIIRVGQELGSPWGRRLRRWRRCRSGMCRRRRIGNACQRVGGNGCKPNHAAGSRLRDELTGCIGCGCLSTQSCPLINPGGIAAAEGDGPRSCTVRARKAAARRWNRGSKADVELRVNHLVPP